MTNTTEILAKYGGRKMSRNSLAKRAAAVVLSFVLFTAMAPFGVFAEEKAAASQRL